MKKLLSEVRLLTIFFIIVLVLSGITAFPVYSELQWIINSKIFPDNSTIEQWLKHVWQGVKNVHEQYPFIFYGFDWLGFAHLIIAVLFIGVYQHPVRNRWVIQWGMISCAAVLPLAFIAGSARGIAFFHILIDCSFGVFGFITLRLMQVRVDKLKKYRSKTKIVGPTQGQL